MNQRTAMIIAAGVTAFTLAAAGAVAVTATALSRTGAAQASVVQPAAATPPANATTGGAAVTSERAAQIALGLAPSAQMTGSPRLVNFEGTVAYEVTLDAGKVYVDAGSGAVLYAAPAQSQARVRPGRHVEEREHDYEHDEYEDEEREHDEGVGGDL